MSFQEVTNTIIECYDRIVSTMGMRTRPGTVQTSKLCSWLVGRTHTLENVGRNEWLYIKQN